MPSSDLEINVPAYETSTITPIGSPPQGTMAPPPTPFATFHQSPFYSEDIHDEFYDTAHESIENIGYKEAIVPATRSENEFVWPSSEPEVNLDDDRRPKVDKSVDELDQSHLSENEQPDTWAISDGQDNLSAAVALTTIPVGLGLSAVGLLAVARPQITEPLDDDNDLKAQFQSDEYRPRTPLDVLQPDKLEVHGPFVDPLKHHGQGQDMSYMVTNLRSPTPMMPPQMNFIPYQAVPLPPRPGTSYSWLGNMFQPIDPRILEAEKAGWITLSDEGEVKFTAAAPPVHRRSLLRRKLKEPMSQGEVPSLFQQYSDLQETDSAKCAIM
jgi:hypothetical protein